MPARLRLVLIGLAAGTAIAFSLPPWGFWPFAFIGFAVFAAALRGQPGRNRLLIGAAVGAAMFGIGLFWITEFQAFGFVALLVLETAFVALGALATPPACAPIVVPATVVLAEALRGAWPFGGLPLGGAALGQAAGPLAPAARIGGPLLVLGITAAVGTALAELASRRFIAAAALVSFAVLATLLGAGDTIPAAPGPPMRVAAVQGGGIRGLRAVETDPTAVYDRQLKTSGQVQPPVDLVVWPEDVVDLDTPLSDAPERLQIGGLAAYLDTTVVVGIVEAAGEEHFRNAAVAFGPDGQVVDRYEKVHRVPFGEYIPGRDLIRHLASLTLIPRDAIPGHGPGRLTTPAGRFGVVISYEVFFADRARAAINAGGSVLLVPTNAASFRTSQVPSQEVAAARLRAVETGRDVVQAAPTGYCAIIDSNGRVLSRSALGIQQVLAGEVHPRHGRTTYLRWGDGPVLLLAVVALALGWVRQRHLTAPSTDGKP